MVGDVMTDRLELAFGSVTFEWLPDGEIEVGLMQDDRSPVYYIRLKKHDVSMLLEWIKTP